MLILRWILQFDLAEHVKIIPIMDARGAGRGLRFRPTAPALSAFVGASLLFISNFVWLGSHYRRRFRADNAIAAACYFAGHFLIVRSLYL